MQSYSGDKQHRCEICDKSFMCASHLNRHKRQHSAVNVQLHMLTHSATVGGEKPHSCLLCDKSFGRASEVKKHMIIHSAMKKHAEIHSNL